MMLFERDSDHNFLEVPIALKTVLQQLRNYTLL